MANLPLIVVALLLALAAIIIEHPKVSALSPKGRLLTPDEGCGISEISTTRIVGGTTAKNGAWPWLALLFYKPNHLKVVTWIISQLNIDESDYGCGGSLITTKHVLTAAHCISDELVFVRLGEYDTETTDDGPHEDVQVTHVEKHNAYNERLLINDIAIVYLVRDIAFNARIRPICVPLEGPIMNRRFVGSNPFLAGWGIPKQSVMWGPFPLINYKLSKILMQVQVPVVSIDECKESYQKIGKFNHEFQIDDRVVCAGFMEGGKDACQGDSGGPLMLPVAEKNGSFPFYQIGIVSYGDGCGRPNLPGVNTNVQYFAGWIKQKISMSFDR